MKQKFGKLTFVKVTDKMPSFMEHFEKGFIGIVDGTYSQLYGGTDINNYALYQTEKGEVINRISWYYEGQLTALKEQDSRKAEGMIEKYNFCK